MKELPISMPWSLSREADGDMLSMKFRFTCMDQKCALLCSHQLLSHLLSKINPEY